MKIFIATKNQKKLRELKRILIPMGFDVLCEKDLDFPFNLKPSFSQICSAVLSSRIIPFLLTNAFPYSGIYNVLFTPFIDRPPKIPHL